MHPHAPFQPNLIINPPLYKQNSSFTSSTTPQSIPQHQERHFNPPGVNYQYRPSSSNGRPSIPNYTFANTHQQPPMQHHRYIKVQSNAKFEGVSQQNKRQQNFEQVRLNYSRQKGDGGRKEPVSASCPNSNNKRAVVQSLIFPTQQTNKDTKGLMQQRLEFYPKIPLFPKANQLRLDHPNQLSIPLNNNQELGYRQTKTDRDMLGRRDNTLIANMSIQNNLKYMRQSIGNEVKVSEYLNPPSSYKNISVQQKHEEKPQPQSNNSHSMKKNMTQATFSSMSSSPSSQNQINAPLQQVPANEKEEKQADQKNQNTQVKKKANFQFFKNIKKKKMSCVLQPQQKQFQLSDFELMDKLGKGAFGDVFIAQQKTTGFICVIKKLSKKKLVEHKLEQQLFRQIKIQSYLNHRHLTSLYGFFNDQDYIYIILQLLPDGSMMHVKKKRKIPENQVSTYIRQISLGLKYMHTQNVIHRDIKPQNIFLYEGYAKIGDFGCSIYTNTYRNTQIGSLAYISPEQLKQSTYNEKIDVWSLGVIAYEMLLGVSPFQKDIIKIARKEMAPELSEVQFPDKALLSEQAKDFLIGMLNTDPDKRFGIQEALRHEFILKYIKQDESKLQKVMG